MQPVPFEITRQDDITKVATNGKVRLIVMDAAGEIRLRRAIRGLSLRPAAELVLPKLNELAGDILQDLSMPSERLLERLAAIVGLVPTQAPQNVEWCYAELDGVRVYVDGENIVVTRQDLQP